MCCLYSFTLKHIIKALRTKNLVFSYFGFVPHFILLKIIVLQGQGGTPSLRTQKIEVSLRQGREHEEADC